MTMRVRLFTLLVVPAAASLILASLIVMERKADHDAAKTASAVAALADDVAALDKALGDEALAGSRLVQFEAAQSRADRLELFALAMQVTDQQLGRVSARLASWSYHPEMTSAVAVVRATLTFREDVAGGTVSPLQILDRYSYVRGSLLDALSTQALVLSTARSQQQLLALVDLIEVRSDHLDERVAVALARRYDRWAPGLHSAVVGSIASQNDHLESANRFLVGDGVEPGPILAQWREQIVVSSDAPAVNARAWAELSDEWIATLDTEIEEQQRWTTDHLAAAESMAAKTQLATLVGVGLALLVAMLIASVVSVRLVKRVSIITRQARRMAAGAATTKTYPHVRGGDELGQLATAFDEMMTHIETGATNQWIESTVLESIVQGASLEEIMAQAVPLLGTDEHGRPGYRFTWTDELPVLDGPRVGPEDRGRGPRDLTISPANSSSAPSVPNLPEFRTAVGLVRMALQRDADHAKLAWQASRDELTGLLNRGAILGRALSMAEGRPESAAAGQMRSGRRRPALMYIDLDDFKGVNDQFGHAAGDLVLVAQSIRLSKLLERWDGIAGRLGGDEFLAVLPAVESEQALADLAERIVDELSRPIPSANGTFQVGVSIGSVLTRLDVPGLKLLNEADAALYQAKKQGKGKALVSTEQLRSEFVETEQLRRDVLEGLERQQFSPWFQPIWGEGGTSLVGVEALARWHHPVRGLVAPGVFVPVADELNLLPRLDRLVFEAVCRQIVAWRHAGHDLRLAHFNLSTAWLEDPEFVADACRILTATDCPPQAIVAEVTESGLMTDISSSSHRLQALRELGVRIAVDDFGQGYSSLAYLSDLPVDVLKIDRRFVARIDEEASNQAIVSAVVSLGDSLGLTIVAEGVERPEELEYLTDAGCDLFQGFLLARPAPIVEITSLLGRSRAVGADGSPGGVSSAAGPPPLRLEPAVDGEQRCG